MATTRTVLGQQSESLGQMPNTIPVRLLPDGGLWVGEGVSVVPQGQAQC